MGNWMVSAVALATVVAVGGVLGMFVWPGWAVNKLGLPKRDMRTLWKVVALGDPVVEGFGLPDRIQFGVVVSTDEMLAQTQTLLVCPLINGVDKKTGQTMAIMPWHVPVEIRQDPARLNGEIEFARKYVSTKIVLPVGAGEIDMDGLERGYLDDRSQAAVSLKLAQWLPPFARIARR